MSTVLWLMAVCNWMYSEAVHRRSKIEDLAQRFVEALRSIIAHCQSPEAGGFTFGLPLAQLSQDELDEALGMVEFEGDMQDEVKKYEDVYPLSPMQQGCFSTAFSLQHPGCISNNQTMSCMGTWISLHLSLAAGGRSASDLADCLVWELEEFR